MSRCLGRLVDDKFRGKFADGHHFHIEQRCSRSVAEGHPLCEKCLARPTEEPKNHPSALHGLIGREIPAWSHIFGSAWYQSKVGKYGTPSEEEMARAKKAVEDNTKDIAPSTGKPATKSRKFKVAASSVAPVAVVAAPVPAPAPAPVAVAAAVKKAPVKRKPKVSAVVSDPTPVAPALVEPKVIESKENVLKISEEDILVISVRRFEHNGRQYFLHSGKDKLYSVGKDGHPLNYVGRYNRQSDTIDADFPDSDQEY